MKKIQLSILAILFLGFISTNKTYAMTAGSSAQLEDTNIIRPGIDKRVVILQQFLEQFNSPLSPYAEVFVREADINHIDWRLVAAISGNESYFGQMIPAESYNGWGFGVYGGNVRRFSSWEEGIATVSKAIRDDYMNKWGAKNIYDIGAIYAEDRMWAFKVSNYSNMIDNFESQSPNTYLSISL